jgi:hypothetical protein
MALRDRLAARKQAGGAAGTPGQGTLTVIPGARAVPTPVERASVEDEIGRAHV